MSWLSRIFSVRLRGKKSSRLHLMRAQHCSIGHILKPSRPVRLYLENLETRLVPSISWSNRGSDRFNEVFHGAADIARSVVDAAINEWNIVIGGPDRRSVDISMNGDTTNRSLGASTSSSLFGTSITIGRGNDGQGGGWYLDPFLFSSAFQGGAGNAFAGYAQAGSPAAGKADLLSVVTHELGHALGFSDANRFATNTRVPDRTAGGGRGFYYAFVGPSGFSTLLTSFDSVGGDTGGAVHSAQPGDAAYPISFGGRTFVGADDLMNPYYAFGQRHLVSRNAAYVLRDTHSTYWVSDPATVLGTFYASVDQGGQLTIRGAQNRPSTDVITLDVSGSNVTVSLRFGNPVPGTADSGAYNVSFPTSRVGSIRVETSAFATVDLYRSPSGVPVNINGNGPLTVNVGTAGTTQGVLGPVYVTDSVAGSAAIYVDDRTDTGRRDVSHGSYTPPGESEFGQISGLTLRGIGYRYASVYRVDVHTGTGATSTYVSASGSPINFISHSTNNSVSIGIGGLVRYIRGTVNVINWVGTTRLTIDDSADTLRHWVTMSGGQLSGLAPADILYSSLASLTVRGGGRAGEMGNVFTVSQTFGPGPTVLYSGPGADTVYVLRTTGSLAIEGQNGSDVVVVGNTVNGVQDIRGMVTVQDSGGRDSLTVDDWYDTTSRTVSMDVSGSTGTIMGLAPATIRYTVTAVHHLYVFGSSSGTGNTFMVRNTASDLTTTVNSGSANNRVFVQGTSGSGPLIINPGAGDTISITSSLNTLNGINDVTVNDVFGTSTVNVDDSGFSGNDTYTLMGGNLGVARLASFSLTYANIANLNLNTGPGSDTFDIDDTFNNDGSSNSTTVTAGIGGNCFHVSPFAQWLGANILVPLTLNGGGAATLDFFDANNLGPETFNFDAIPSSLNVSSTGSTIANFTGMGAIYVVTNGRSSWNDLSGTVNFDWPGGPPCTPSGGGTTGKELAIVPTAVTSANETPKPASMLVPVHSIGASTHAQDVTKPLDRLAVDEVFSLGG